MHCIRVWLYCTYHLISLFSFNELECFLSSFVIPGVTSYHRSDVIRIVLCHTVWYFCIKCVTFDDCLHKLTCVRNLQLFWVAHLWFSYRRPVAYVNGL